MPVHFTKHSEEMSNWVCSAFFRWPKTGKNLSASFCLLRELLGCWNVPGGLTTQRPAVANSLTNAFWLATQPEQLSDHSSIHKGRNMTFKNYSCLGETAAGYRKNSYSIQFSGWFGHMFSTDIYLPIYVSIYLWQRTQTRLDNCGCFIRLLGMKLNQFIVYTKKSTCHTNF